MDKINVIYAIQITPRTPKSNILFLSIDKTKRFTHTLFQSLCGKITYIYSQKRTGRLNGRLKNVVCTYPFNSYTILFIHIYQPFQKKEIVDSEK